MKLCKDCKHIDKSPFGTVNHCQRATGVDLLNGGEKQVNEYCSIQRATGWVLSRLFNLCGKEGRFYEEKEGKCQGK